MTDPEFVVNAISVTLWLLAGCISLYFSFGNARIWTSISTGFFLVFLSQAYLLAPGIVTPRLIAIHSIIGTISVMVLTYGFQEYYVFSRTMEVSGNKAAVYITTILVVSASFVFLAINPQPEPATLRHIRIIENSNWVFLSLINLDMIRKIIRQLKGSEIAKGFVAFMVVFGCIILWRGAELYLQVYAWDKEWAHIINTHGGAPDTTHATRVAFSRIVQRIFGFGSSSAVGATFLYLFRLLR